MNTVDNALAKFDRRNMQIYLLEYSTEDAQIKVKLKVHHRNVRKTDTFPVLYKDTRAGLEPYVIVEGRHILLSQFKFIRGEN